MPRGNTENADHPQTVEFDAKLATPCLSRCEKRQPSEIPSKSDPVCAFLLILRSSWLPLVTILSCLPGYLTSALKSLRKTSDSPEYRTCFLAFCRHTQRAGCRLIRALCELYMQRLGSQLDGSSRSLEKASKKQRVGDFRSYTTKPKVPLPWTRSKWYLESTAKMSP